MPVRHTICPPQPDTPPAAAADVQENLVRCRTQRTSVWDSSLPRAYTRTKYDPAGTLGTVNVVPVLLVSKFARLLPPGELPA